MNIDDIYLQVDDIVSQLDHIAAVLDSAGWRLADARNRGSIARLQRSAHDWSTAVRLMPRPSL